MIQGEIEGERSRALEPRLQVFEGYKIVNEYSSAGGGLPGRGNTLPKILSSIPLEFHSSSYNIVYIYNSCFYKV